MEKQINFQGINLTPYSDISPDGQLAVCNGLERHAGSLRPISLNGTDYPITGSVKDVRLLAVHNTADFNHFIFYRNSDGSLYWSNQSESGLSLSRFGAVKEVKSASTIGNTLVLVSSSGISYFLFTEESGNYTDLGEMPEIELSFGLQGQMVETEEHAFDIEAIQGSSSNASAFWNKEFSENNKRIITDQVMGEVNRFITEKSVAAGKFIFPFFIRYAYRLYDGTLTRHSAPVLMVCASGPVPVARSRFVIDGDHNQLHQIKLHVYAAVHTLVYRGVSVPTVIGYWKDIIKSVDLFISEPLYTIDLSGTCKSFTQVSTTRLLSPYCLCKHTNKGSGASGQPDYYQEWNYTLMWQRTFEETSTQNRTILPEKTQEEINGLIRNCANFYLLTSVQTGEIPSGYTAVDVPEGVLQNLVFKERMTDDYDSHDKLIPRFAYAYNSRLNIGNISKRLFDGFPSDSMFCYTNGYYNYPSGSDNLTGSGSIDCYVHINDRGKEIVTKVLGKLDFSKLGICVYVYYPNTNAYKITFVHVFVFSGGANRYLELPLTPHPLLNGAYYFGGFDPKSFSSVSNLPSVTPEDKRVIEYPNKIYTSEVGNPFYFPLSGINTVGIGEIVGMSAITTALSQGQFGQFPLMVFCTDGNYAMQTNNEGLFSGISPMQRDVCTNGESITQIDGAVIFVSARGIMTADGSLIRCISEVLEGVPETLDGIDLNMPVPKMSVLPPVDFFQNCLPAYDYAGKRILFFSKNEDTAWVLSLEDASWGQAQLGNVAGIVNVYPYAYIQFGGSGKITRLDKPYPFKGEKKTGLIVTRPLKLDSLQYKSLRQLVLEGSFSTPQTLRLYGSNNGKDWFALGKSTSRRILVPGRYFKYYRIAIETSLDEAENLSGMRIQYEIRPETRFR